MAYLTTTPLGNALSQLWNCDEIVPGSQIGYQLAKSIYVYHPLGSKIAKSPIEMAQSQARKITVAGAPESAIEAFDAEHERLHTNAVIRSLATQARVYGIASIALLVEGDDPATPLDMDRVADPNKNITFNVLDPLNTAGSLIGNLDPNSFDFLKADGVTVQGQSYHRSRTCVLMNEEPIYLEYSTSAWGYVGRSCYLRALYPLKSFLSTMVADDMVARKAGLLIAKMKQPGSIANNIMQSMFGQKRSLLKEAETDNVLSVDIEESIETLNMQNVNSAMDVSRSNMLKNIATAVPMPAKLLDNETFVEGFGEGSEDAKNIARYVDGVREDLRPVYKFFDDIVMRRAWSEDFVKAVKKGDEDLAGKDFKTIFYGWKNSFTAEWPSLLKEPESEEVRVTDVKLKAIIAMVQVLAPEIDPENKTRLLQWAADNINELKLMFGTPLELDWETLEQFLQENKNKMDDAMKEPSVGHPFAAQDAVRAYDGSVESLLEHMDKKRSVGARSRQLDELR